MVLLVGRSYHEMIWLPDGNEVPDRKKHMIYSPKLVLMFACNPHGFQVVDSMLFHDIPKGEMFTAVYYIRNLLTEIVARRGVERSERRLVKDADNARPHTAKVRRTFWDHNFLRIA
jgi:hypothetical protein